MQLIETSDGYVVFSIIEEESSKTDDNVKKILDIAKKNPNKQIVISDDPADFVNHDVILDLLSNNNQYDNITVSGELWGKLLKDNFKYIKKSLIRSELGNIIGTSDDSVNRASVAMEIIAPRGAQNISTDIENGKEIITGNVDSQECVIDVSYGRPSDEGLTTLYSDQITPNIKITISVRNKGNLVEVGDIQLEKLADNYYVPKDYFSNKYLKEGFYLLNNKDYYKNNVPVKIKDNIERFNMPNEEMKELLKSKTPYHFWYEDNGKAYFYGYGKEYELTEDRSTQDALLIPIYVM